MMIDIETMIKSYKRICWYPSAGADFRELLFLSEQYCRWKDVPVPSTELPDLFILTDCNPKDIFFTKTIAGLTCIEKLNEPEYSQMEYLFDSLDKRTFIALRNKIKCIGTIDVPFDSRLFHFKPSNNYGNVYFIQAKIYSKKLGVWNADILYILTENTNFALHYLIKHHICIDYLVRVRYGDAFGSSVLSGEWLLKLLHPLNVTYFLSKLVTEDTFNYIPELLLTDNYSDYKDLLTDTNTIALKELHHIPAIRWSNQGDIYWYRVES